MPTDRPRPSSVLTRLMWAVSLACVILGGAIAGLFVLMASSLEPTDLLSDGVEPYTDAAIAAGAFVGLVLAAAAGLLAWHSVRFRAIGVVLTACEVGLVAWGSLRVYNDYF